MDRKLSWGRVCAGYWLAVVWETGVWAAVAWRLLSAGGAVALTMVTLTCLLAGALSVPAPGWCRRVLLPPGRCWSPVERAELRASADISRRRMAQLDRHRGYAPPIKVIDLEPRAWRR